MMSPPWSNCRPLKGDVLHLVPSNMAKFIVCKVFSKIYSKFSIDCEKTKKLAN